jgi:putative effector of murein hydrolase
LFLSAFGEDDGEEFGFDLGTESTWHGTDRALQVIPTIGPLSNLSMGLVALFSLVVMLGLVALLLRGL